MLLSSTTVWWGSFQRRNKVNLFIHWIHWQNGSCTYAKPSLHSAPCWLFWSLDLCRFFWPVLFLWAIQMRQRLTPHSLSLGISPAPWSLSSHFPMQEWPECSSSSLPPCWVFCIFKPKHPSHLWRLSGSSGLSNSSEAGCSREVMPWHLLHFGEEEKTQGLACPRIQQCTPWHYTGSQLSVFRGAALRALFSSI